MTEEKQYHSVFNCHISTQTTEAKYLTHLLSLATRIKTFQVKKVCCFLVWVLVYIFIWVKLSEGPRSKPNLNLHHYCNYM